eukprot:CAMPEP_0194159076 /NCGR_PEP_ID=MMETSP0152-20130528/77627_1 /TAXON_ID=1049557 /ORGANISM="Thalassiothrix antarctica, Strain L6-D1" /LENGTH=222 /DNA_ID=CAMNT_0038868595 /DNA_START=129 /DNA_END=797 /DNA_ORIENTATION=-
MPPPRLDRPMPPPHGTVVEAPHGAVVEAPHGAVVEGRIPGSHGQMAGDSWHDRAGNPGHHTTINTSHGTFSTYTDACKEPRMPLREDPAPTRVAGGYNQQATGSWWDRAGQVQSHDTIDTSAGTFNSYTEACAPASKSSNQQDSAGGWWDRAGQVQSHNTIDTTAGTFNSYTEACAPDSKSSNQQDSAGGWWDRAGAVQSHDTIDTSAGFRTHTDISRENRR